MLVDTTVKKNTRGRREVRVYTNIWG